MTLARHAPRLRRTVLRASGATLVALVLAASMPPRALAHDCSGPDDCAVLPPNVNIGTGIAAILAGASAGWLLLRRRFRDSRPPCDHLRKEVSDGKARIAALEAQIAAAKSGLDSPDLQGALAREVALQAGRVAALALCETSAYAAVPPSVDDTLRAAEEARKHFEELQQALKDEAAKQLASLAKFNSDYDRIWAEAMRATEDYLRDYPELLGDLEKIWEEFGNREWAREVAEWVDVGIQAAMIGLDAYHLGAGVVRGLAAEEAALAGRALARSAEGAGARAGAAAQREAAAVAERELVELSSEGGAKRVAADEVTSLDDLPEVAAGSEPLGRATFLGDDAATLAAAEKIAPMPGYYDVIIHGSPDGFTLKQMVHGNLMDIPYNAAELAAMMRRAGYKGGKVRLLSCSSGNVVGATGPRIPVASELADILKVEVVAPDATVFINTEGALRMGAKAPDQPRRWIRFTPRE